MSRLNQYYRCPVCERKSYNPNDVRNKYCGNCHRFEDQINPDFLALLQALPTTDIPEDAVWVTANRLHLPIADMDDEHLTNTVRMLINTVRVKEREVHFSDGDQSIWSREKWARCLAREMTRRGIPLLV